MFLFFCNSPSIECHNSKKQGEAEADQIHYVLVALSHKCQMRTIIHSFTHCPSTCLLFCLLAKSQTLFVVCFAIFFCWQIESSNLPFGPQLANFCWYFILLIRIFISFCLCADCWSFTTIVPYLPFPPPPSNRPILFWSSTIHSLQKLYANCPPIIGFGEHCPDASHIKWMGSGHWPQSDMIDAFAAFVHPISPTSTLYIYIYMPYLCTHFHFSA